MTTKTRLSDLNRCSPGEFVSTCGPCFEHSPWIAERTASRRPFASVEDLHRALVATMNAAPESEQLALVRAHPDLVGRMAEQDALTPESTREQAAAGLSGLSADEVTKFRTFNEQYRSKFEFPFVICARENKKDAILAAFPVRLANSREQELTAALAEIAKIARLRLVNIVEDH